MIMVVSITLETNNVRNRLVTHGPSVAKTILTCGNRVNDILLYGLPTYVLFDDRHLYVVFG